jgi:hypothetical protein
MRQHQYKGLGSIKRVAGAAMVAAVWFACIAITPPPARAQAAATQKTVQGRVLEDGDKPVVGAIVYLQDGRTNNIRSFVSVEGGNYRFGQLSMDTDYQLWAGFKDRKSPVKNISSFDAKKQLVIDLHLK